MKLKVKVCGMTHFRNIKLLGKLPVDMVGFIFYPGSPRYAKEMEPIDLASLPAHVKKVGVFVNEKLDVIMRIARKLGLDTVQLHGDEPAGLCRVLRSKGLQVIKAFPVKSSLDLLKTADYEGECDYFLFDTKTPWHGGAGVKFDWNILSAYNGRTPFFLSGGITVDDAETIRQMQFPMLCGVDLNSKFEVTTGIKNIKRIKQFMDVLDQPN